MIDPENAIEIRNMSKSFKVQYDKANSLKSLLVIRHRKKAQRIQVLQDISLDIRKGETVGLVGSNGSGKSTLLKLMTKIYYPDCGTIETNGKLTSLLELGAGFHPDFTGRENIYFNASIFGLTKKEIDNRIDEIIDFSELGDFIDEPIRTYSSGMYMRLAFSVAINVDADILLIDEILAVGDQHFQEKCYGKLHELKDQKKTIVFVSHSPDIVKELCTRAIWIYNGHFQLDGTPAYVIDKYLKQIEIDHQEQHRKDLAEGKVLAKGAVYIDVPKDFSVINLIQPNVKISGWQVTDSEKAHFELSIGGQCIPDEQITYSPRKDVLNYLDDYRGLVDENKIGFNYVADLTKFEQYCNAEGNLHVHASMVMDDGKILSEREITLELTR